MKNVFSCARNGLLVIGLITTPLYSQSVQGWVVNNPVKVVVGTAAVCGACYAMAKTMKQSNKKIKKSGNKVQCIGFDIGIEDNFVNEDTVCGDEKTRQVVVVGVEQSFDTVDVSIELENDEDQQNNEEVVAQAGDVVESIIVFECDDSVNQENVDQDCDEIDAMDNASVNELIAVDNKFVYVVSPEMHSVSFKMKDESFSITKLNIEEEVLRSACNVLIDQKDQLSEQNSLGKIQMVSNNIDFAKVFISSEESILLSGKASVGIVDGFLVAPMITLVGNTMTFDNCFVDTDELFIKSNAAQAGCVVVRVIFNKNSAVPAGLKGYIDFTSNEQYGDCDLMLMGVEKVEIEFALHAL